MAKESVKMQLRSKKKQILDYLDAKIGYERSLSEKILATLNAGEPARPDQNLTLMMFEATNRLRALDDARNYIDKLF